MVEFVLATMKIRRKLVVRESRWLEMMSDGARHGGATALSVGTQGVGRGVAAASWW